MTRTRPAPSPAPAPAAVPSPPPPGRRAGHALGALVDAVLLVAIHAWPGWDVVPLLTGETPRVLGVVTAALVAGLVVHLVQVLRTPAWVAPAGLVVTSALGAVATAAVYRVFPFDVTGGWEVVFRVVLVVGVVGSCIGVVAALASLLRMYAAGSSR
ncbi:hypothetical protein [Trujillonella humicola]|uniref:hypothetical protein n=1 Tax=Trujillonella humicola TaxID=3383699 RepID=UPI0039063308